MVAAAAASRPARRGSRRTGTAGLLAARNPARAFAEIIACQQRNLTRAVRRAGRCSRRCATARMLARWLLWPPGPRPGAARRDGACGGP